MTNHEATIRVTDNPSAHRFEIWSDSTLAGMAFYRLVPGKIVFRHTEVDPAFEGKGLGTRLATFALDTARERGLEVVPLCPFIAGYIESHPDYADLVAAG